MNYVAAEVIKNYDFLDEQAKGYSLHSLDSNAVEKGIQNSGQATRQDEFVHPTPLMKNALIVYGDVTQIKDGEEFRTEKLKAGVESKAQIQILKMLRAAMNKEFGQEITEYPSDLPFTDPKYYYVDCWNALISMEKGKFWDIVPKQRDQVADTVKVYEDPKTNLSVDEMRNLLHRNVPLQKTLELENKMWPSVKASRDIVKISDPFMSKKSGVSYPDYHNDAALVDPKKVNSITWGAYEIEEAKKAYSKGDDYFFNWLYTYAVNTLYMRRQRGKGRALIALSRRTNLGLNMVNGVEMSEVKDSYQINIPFLNEDEILRELTVIAKLALSNNLLPVNIDSTMWDANLGAGIVNLQNAERYTLGIGEFTKKMIVLRNNVTLKSWLVDGIKRRATRIYGRMTSGSDDTTLGNTKANRTISVCSALATDAKYVSDVIGPMKRRHALTVGDDLLIVLRDKSMIEKFVDYITKTFKIVVHKDEKFALGVMFIQWRLFMYYGKFVMAYNVPRVVRSMCSKEDAKHLGRGGWTFSFWQQLSKLRRFKKALKIAVNIMASFDQYHLSLDVPVEQLIEMVKQEDELAAKTGSSETTAERMYRSNPNIAGLKEDNGHVILDKGYFHSLQKEMKAVYDPTYLKQIGFEIPDLSKIK